MAHEPSRRRVGRSISQSFSISKEGVSLWSATSKEPSIPALDKSINADVCIVGAGIAGMTTAYLLALEGKSVVILDKSQIGSGETAHTTAHLSSVIDAGYREIEVLHGTKGFPGISTIFRPSPVENIAGTRLSPFVTRGGAV